MLSVINWQRSLAVYSLIGIIKWLIRVWLWQFIHVVCQLQIVQTASAATSSVVTVAMPFYTLPAVQPVLKVTPVSQTPARPAETITTLSQNPVTALPRLMPAKTVTLAMTSTVAVASTTTATLTSATSSTAVMSSPTSGSRPPLRVIIPSTRSVATSDDVSWVAAVQPEYEW